jgi:hypothetical protein
MPILHIEHSVPNFDGWKRAFDADPVGRAKSGVRRYRVARPLDDPLYVMIDLEFDTLDQAQAFQAALRGLWTRVEGQIIHAPRTRVLETVESREY